jgi:hypothetical protein
MSDFWDNVHEGCLDNAPHVGQEIGYATGGIAAAPFAVSVVGESVIPPAWGLGQFETGAAGALAFEGGKELGTVAGTHFAEGACNAEYAVGNAVEHTYGVIHDYFSPPDPPAAPAFHDWDSASMSQYGAGVPEHSSPAFESSHFSSPGFDAPSSASHGVDFAAATHDAGFGGGHDAGHDAGHAGGHDAGSGSVDGGI